MIDRIKEAIDFAEFEKPLIWIEDPNDKEFNSDISLFIPYGKARRTILYIYSMEFGSPPLY